MSRNKVDVSWHIVCGSVEIEELSRSKHIKEWKPRNERHALFYAIKYPDEQFFKGSWGPELLHFVNDGPYRGQVGKIHCTYERYVEIARWFLLSMYKA